MFILLSKTRKERGVLSTAFAAEMLFLHDYVKI